MSEPGRGWIPPDNTLTTASGEIQQSPDWIPEHRSCEKPVSGFMFLHSGEFVTQQGITSTLGQAIATNSSMGEITSTKASNEGIFSPGVSPDIL